MTYYFFNKCDEDKLPQIGDLASRLGLEERASEPPSREWSLKGDSNVFWLIRYSPRIDKTRPLLLQTEPHTDHRNSKQVLAAVKEIISITGTTRVSDLDDTLLYGMNEFK